MFKYAPKNMIFFKFYTIILVSIFFTKASANFEPFREAVVQKIIEDNKILALSDRDDWNVGEILAVVSQNSKLGTIAFLEIVAVGEKVGNQFEIRLSLQRQSRKHFIQVGDFIKRLDLSTVNSEYIGTTDLLIHKSEINISSKYRPLVHQGFVIGDTAQTLFEKELLINYFGNIYYGYNDWLTLGTLAPVNVLGRPNFNLRAKVYDTESTTLSTGISFVRLIKEDEASVNLNFYWDSTSSDALISHTFVGLGLVTWNGAKDAAALKYLTTNSFQTGYEVVLNNWDRFLIGPNYNFEKKALGGYLSYIWMMDRFHMQASVNATDITHVRLDPTDGYYGFFDMYWRF